jgi:hypothetical protein
MSVCRNGLFGLGANILRITEWEGSTALSLAFEDRISQLIRGADRPEVDRPGHTLAPIMMFTA